MTRNTGYDPLNGCTFEVIMAVVKLCLCSLLLCLFLFFENVSEQKPPAGAQARLGAAVQVGAWTKCLTALARGWPVDL